VGLSLGIDRPDPPMAVIIELSFVMAAKGKVKNLAEFAYGNRIKNSIQIDALSV